MAANKSRKYANQTLALLWGNSGNLCAFPGCNQKLTKSSAASDPGIVVGEIAHIVGFGQDGPKTPRPDPLFPTSEINRYTNLILLCPTHHTIVDKQPNTYSVLDLRNWKTAREKLHDEQISRGFPNITFIEIEQILLAIPLAKQDSAPIDFTLLPIKDKVAKNALSNRSEKLLTLGYVQLKNVEAYIEGVAQTDTSYPERLRAGFLKIYSEALSLGFAGDELLLGLKERIINQRPDILLEAAAISVILYYFEKCEIFEK